MRRVDLAERRGEAGSVSRNVVPDRWELVLGSELMSAVVSAAAAFATEAAHLVAARALLGVFGAMLMPSTLALLRTLFGDRTQRRLALAIWATGFAAGAALGPVIGGVLLEHAWWGSVFLVNVPVMVVLLALAPVVLPESRGAGRAVGQLDLLGLILSMLTMVALVLGVKTFGSDIPLALAELIVATAAGWAFVARARARIRAGREPLLDVDLFEAPPVPGGRARQRHHDVRLHRSAAPAHAVPRSWSPGSPRWRRACCSCRGRS